MDFSQPDLPHSASASNTSWFFVREQVLIYKLHGKIAEHVLLCLKCRGKSHDVEHGPSEAWENELSWMFSQARRSLDVVNVSARLNQITCPRCESLDLIQLLEHRPPWNSQTELTEAFEEGNDSIRNLGKTGSIEFWGRLFCLSLSIRHDAGSHFFGTGGPSAPGLDHLSRLRRAGDQDGRSREAELCTCLLSVLKPSSVSLPVPVVGHRGDALCIVESDVGPQRTLGGRRIDHRAINVDMILGWIESCLSRRDEACAPVPTKDLEAVRFIDVES